MGKSLVIVESPAKAKTINKYLGNDFIVKSSVGHVRDLPTGANRQPVDPKERARQAAITRKLSPEDKVVHKRKKDKVKLVEKMGIDPENDWKAQYEVLPGKEKVVNELRKLAQDADTIYLATDLDREGEAIAWHLKEIIGDTGAPYKRVVFNEITKSAIKEAFETPAILDQDRVDAQQARRFLDRVVGFMVSPLLWAKIARGLSAGRVQSVAVRLVVEREAEIRVFIPEEYWEAFSHLNSQEGDAIRFQVNKENGQNFKPDNEEQAMKAVAVLESQPYVVTKREDKPTRSRPSAPFITSTLQQAASTRLGFGVKKTMMMAQRLYEGGYITYMRTDSTNLSQDAVNAAREFIADIYGDKYLPAEPKSYSSKEGAQEAHEAIRPSDVRTTSGEIKSLETDALRLYELIRQRFMACQMTDAEFTSSTLLASCGDYELKAKGRVIRFDGHLRAMTAQAKNEDDYLLPDLKTGDKLALDHVEPKQHFTKPTARFNEASLVRELEKRGIGRPSTYAAIISTIQDRGYARIEGKRFYAEKMGEIVTSRLTENFSELLDYDFTANMEEKLDGIAQGSLKWKDVLDNFYEDFTQDLYKASDDETGMRLNPAVKTDLPCPDCGRNMQIRTGTTGVFLGCEGYALPPKERCSKTMNLTSGDEAVGADEDDEAESLRLRKKRRCGICNTAMESYLVDETRKLHICGNNPDCVGFEVEAGEFVIKGYDGPSLECDKCGDEMQLKNGRFGKYFGCMSEDCKNTRKLLRSGQPAPPKMDPVPCPELQCIKVDDTYILRDGAAGLFLAASQFPKNRETRAPKVFEMIPHKAELPEKYHFLMDAPTEDANGNKSMVRFSRKTQELYVSTDNEEGKASGWTAYFEGGKWVASEKAKRAPAKKASAKKSTAKKSSAKKTSAKKTSAKKSSVKKTSAKKTADKS